MNNKETSTIKLLFEKRREELMAVRCDGFTLLHLVAQYNTEMLNIFIFAGMDVNAKSSKSATPLHTASQNGSDECVESLIAHDANILQLTDGGWNSLDVAKFYNKPSYKISTTHFLKMKMQQNMI